MACAHPAKTQISLGICPVRSESLLYTQWVAKDPSFHHADSKDSDQTGRMPRLIRVFARRTCHFVGFDMRRLNYLAMQITVDIGCGFGPNIESELQGKRMCLTCIICCASGSCVPGCLWNTLTTGRSSLSLVVRSALITGPWSMHNYM